MYIYTVSLVARCLATPAGGREYPTNTFGTSNLPRPARHFSYA
jgi:hypothetical protein